MSSSQKKILITGASSQVGAAIRPHLREDYDLRLHYNTHPIEPLFPGEEQVQGDITDLSAMRSIMDGIDAIVHLAGQARSKATWDQVRGPNIDGAYNVFEAARLGGIRKIVFASTNRVTGMYDIAGEWPIGPEHAVRPDSYYGVTKVFGEALARFYVDRFEMSIICLRIGWVLEQPHNEKALRQWLSPRDCAQLVRLSLETEQKFGVYFGASDNTRLKWDIRNARHELGYKPQDNSEIFAVNVLETAEHKTEG